MARLYFGTSDDHMTIYQMQQLAWDWGVRCFGLDHMTNRSVRALRLVEEAIEAAQVCAVPKDQLHRLIDMVYDRPPGSLTQELGGTLITTGVLAYQGGHALDDLMFEELSRCLSKTAESFAQRNKDKIQLGLTG